MQDYTKRLYERLVYRLNIIILLYLYELTSFAQTHQTVLQNESTTIL